MLRNTTKILGLMLAILSTAAFARPDYPGYSSNTAGDPGIGSEGPGYYIWSDVTQKNWKVRWQSNQPSLPGNIVSWEGSVEFLNGTLGSTGTYQFENSGTYADSLNVSSSALWGDEISFSAVTNQTGGVDGFDFSLTGGSEVLAFALWSSFFDQEAGTEASKYIFIGSNADNPDVLINRAGAQFFDVHVAEPGSIALMGLGLLGLALARRKA